MSIAKKMTGVLLETSVPFDADLRQRAVKLCTDQPAADEPQRCAEYAR